MSILVQRNVFRAKDLVYGEEAIALYLKPPGFIFDLKYTYTEMDGESYKPIYSESNKGYFHDNKVPLNLIKLSSQIEFLLLSQKEYVDCVFRFVYCDGKIPVARQLAAIVGADDDAGLLHTQTVQSF